jgi:tRNA pseudouridine55 synthase
MAKRRRDDADLHGLLNVCKARGFTSHDVVAMVRRTLGTRRVGHAGTLDPLAEGVLPICVGRYTRLVDQLADTEKGYYAELELGARTATDDAEGEIVERRPVPPLTRASLEPFLDRFRGEIQQVPPIYSAIKVDGRRAYDLARRGDAPALKARPVTISRLSVVSLAPPRLALLVACSKGTYIRSLARDLGEALGCGAHLTRLVRLWVGSFRLEDAVSLDEIGAAAEAGRVDSVLHSAEDALAKLPALLLSDRRLIDFGHGRSWPADIQAAQAGPRPTTGAPTRVYDTGGRLIGLAEHDLRRHAWQPRLALIQAPGSGPGTRARQSDNEGGGDGNDG